MTNSLAKDAELKWTGFSGEEKLTVWKNSAVNKEVAVTSPTQPQPFNVTAYERGTTNMLKLNGANFVRVPLLLIKQTVDISLSGGRYLR